MAKNLITPRMLAQSLIDLHSSDAEPKLHRYMSNEERAWRFAQGLDSWPRHLCEARPPGIKFTTDGHTLPPITFPVPQPESKES